MTLIPYFRVFLSSPGDVLQERQIALDIIERLPYRPAFREKVAFRVIAWDKPGADTPMLATLPPPKKPSTKAYPCRRCVTSWW